MADTRQEILDNASDLFIELGYDRTSLRAIAERVGVTKAALYYHFPSKEALLDALVSPAFGFLRELMPGFLATTDPVEWSRLIGRIVDWMVTQERLFALLSRNREVLQSLHESSLDFAEHDDLHESFRALTIDSSIPLENRIRLMGAIGLATSLFEFGGDLLTESPEEVGPILRSLVDVVMHTPIAASVDPAAATA